MMAKNSYRSVTIIWGLALLLSGMAAPAQAQFGDFLKKHADKFKKAEDASKPLTVQQEIDIGREVAAKVIAYYHLYQNPMLTRYVNMVGDTVAAQSERQDIKYHFAILDSDAMNAFSAPGGFVFITRGAVELCDDESELAGVLAHEVGHVSGKHVLHAIQRGNMMKAGMDEASAYAPGSEYMQQVSKNILTKLLEQGLAPGDEFDADARGVRYAHAAGYPADGLERFLAKLDKVTNQSNSFWVRTHPLVSQRNARISQLIASEHWEDADRPKLADRFSAATAMLPKFKGTGSGM
jgi:predicted Zn-dependent protease